MLSGKLQPVFGGMRNFKLLLISERVEVEVTTANRGHQGLEVAQTGLPDLILLDLKLSDMSGLDLIDRLKKNDATRRIPVVLVAGTAD